MSEQQTVKLHPNRQGGLPTVGRVVHYFPNQEAGCVAAIVVRGVMKGPVLEEDRFWVRALFPDGSDRSLTLFVDSDFWHWPERT